MRYAPEDTAVIRALRDSALWEVLVAIAVVLVLALVTWGITSLLARWLSGKTRFGLRGVGRLVAPLTAIGGAAGAILLLNRSTHDPPIITELLRLFSIMLGFWLAARMIDVAWATTQASARLRAGPRVGSLLLAGRHLSKLVLALTAIGVLAVQSGASEQLYVLLAAAAAGAAFAARDPLRNAVAFASLAVDPPFHVGDRVRISDFRSGESSIGTITDISLTSVTIRTREHTNVVIANVMLPQLRIENLTSAERRRLELEIPVVGLPTEALRDACPAIDREIREHPDVSSERAPRVWLAGASDGLRLKVSLWLRRGADRRKAQGELLLKIHEHITA